MHRRNFHLCAQHNRHSNEWIIELQRINKKYFYWRLLVIFSAPTLVHPLFLPKRTRVWFMCLHFPRQQYLWGKLTPLTPRGGLFELRKSNWFRSGHMPMWCDELSAGKVLGKDSLLLRENYKKRQERNKKDIRKNKYRVELSI